MCWSAEADLVAAAVTGSIGVDALRHIRRRAEVLIASLPLLFAAHQLVEAFVWWGLDGRVDADVGHGATVLYLGIAFVVVPVLVPLAVGSLEATQRRLLFGVVVGLGVVAASMLLASLLHGEARASIVGRHISYHVDIWHGEVAVVLYTMVTCGSLLLSTRSSMRSYGVANLVAVAGLIWLERDGFVSLWCVWAALTSAVIALEVRRVDELLSVDVVSA